MDDRQLWTDGAPSWERDLDTLVRPSLVTEPPADVQASILAAVLHATAAPQQLPSTVAAPIPTAAQPIPLAAYLLLAAVLVAYLAALSWFQGLVGGGGWLPTLVEQLMTVSELVVGRLPADEPLALLRLVAQRAPWIALLPLVWLLWERDRSATRPA